jgi:hypothetical protein
MILSLVLSRSSSDRMISACAQDYFAGLHLFLYRTDDTTATSRVEKVGCDTEKPMVEQQAPVHAQILPEIP